MQDNANIFFTVVEPRMQPFLRLNKEVDLPLLTFSVKTGKTVRLITTTEILFTKIKSSLLSDPPCSTRLVFKRKSLVKSVIY